jgi:hypothetical protein
MPHITSTGQCALCGETFSKRAISRHLIQCQAEHPVIIARGKRRKTLHLLVEGQYLPEYWMHLEVPADAPLLHLDAFLRDLWLECCGHLSAFTIEGVRYELDTGGIDGMWTEIFGPTELPESMKTPMDKVLHPGLKFFHEYDFGTTTHLALKVLAEQENRLSKNAIYILARNLPPPIKCAKCEALATQVCVECIDTEAGWLCEEHAEKHKHGDMFLPVVNSPRVGQCGYTGPLED